MTSAKDTTSDTRLALHRAALAGLAAFLLAIAFYSPARLVITPELDASNYATYSRFTALEAQYGPEVLPLAGPYGFVPYGFLYAGHLYSKRLALEFLTKLILGSLIVWLATRPGSPRLLGFAWVATLVLLTPMVEDLPYDIAVLLTGLGLVHFHAQQGMRPFAIAGGLATFLALLTLFKGTQAVLALATFGLLGVQAILLRNFRRWLLLAAMFLTALAVWLLLAGQYLPDFPLYLRGMLELSSGYNLAMGLDEPTGVFWCGLGAFVALEALIALRLVSRWRDPVVFAAGLFFAGFTFIKWKHGFVRADGHVLIFFHYVCAAVPAVWLFSNSRPFPAPPWLHRSALALSALAFGLALWTNGAAPHDRLSWSTAEWLRRLPVTWSQLTDPGTDKSRLDAVLRTRRSTYELGAVRETVGNTRIDFFGTELGYLMLNQLNYRPRPMGGGTFSVFSPWLQDRNLAHFADASIRPDYVLANPTTIDHRLPIQDDPGTLYAITQLYTPTLAEQGMLLLRTKPSANLELPRRFRSVPISLGVPFEIPEVGQDELLLVSFELPFNLAGRARAFLYKAPLIYVDLEGEGIHEKRDRRLIPSLATRPMLLDPYIEDTSDLLSLFTTTSRKRARTLTIHTSHPGLWDGGSFQANFYRAQKPADLEKNVLQSLQDRLSYPLADTTPAEVSAVGAPRRRFEGLPVQMLEPPGRIAFALAGDERAVQFKTGIDELAYLGGKSDGVEFYVDLERPGQPSQTLFRRWLQPATVTGDRGTQQERVILPPFPSGSNLVLRTDPGPHKNGAWDWGYFTAIRLSRGLLQIEQFPGFNRAPATIDSANCGALTAEGRKIFLFSPPGQMEFNLSGTERRCALTAGLLEGAYTNGNQSDGYGVVVELVGNDGSSPRILHSQTFNPLGNPADRGDRALEIPIPPSRAGDRLRFRMTPGPQGSPAWDWCYLTRFEIH